MDSITSKVLYNKQIAPGLFRIGIEWKSKRICPGQFVMVRVSDSLDPFLRRPLGIYKVLGEKQLKGGGYRGTGIELLYSVVGRGTALLSTRVPGDRVGLLGPIGNGFPNQEKGQKIIMVAGSVGIVPFYLIAKALGKEATVLIGARSKEAKVLAADFSPLKCKVGIATEDGSVGTKGLVTELLKRELQRLAEDKETQTVVYACGPTGMLRAVAAVAQSAAVDSYVSLERSMACGIGVCLGCAVKGTLHSKVPASGALYAMVCSDGPVFKGSNIEWDRL